ncbi:MAG TPA: SpoIIE family protein phosphatase [Terriglobia bacterium]|nr:SpoIIE family protein phosphatase [Terriglobia bacterium]
MEEVNHRLIDWHVAGSTRPGETESGDLHVVQDFADGILLGVVDGLGHGEEAAAAGRAALEVLTEFPQEPVISLVERCHERLRSTRGVVLSLASFSVKEKTMTWMGVGNVEGVLLRCDPDAIPRHESLLLRSGVVGDCLPRLSASIVPVMPGDMLIFATDGIRSDFPAHVNPGDSPQRIAGRIFAECARKTDDALVLVTRFVHEHKATQPG